MALAETLGLVKLKRNSKPDDSHFDLFRDRLMFPIFSATADVIGFGGRTLQPEGLPKYLNSSDSPVFNKSRVLYGIHETGKFIRAEDCAIVVEGYMDAIALYTAGIKNVVAILGTAFTPEHAKVLKRYSLNVIMLLDGDEAGLNGAERSLPILLAAGLTARGFALPDKMDPDDYIKAHGFEKLREEIARAPELFTLLLSRRWMQAYRGTASEKVRVVEQATEILGGAQNRQLVELYLLEIARQLDVDVPWVRKAMNQVGGSRPQPSTGGKGAQESIADESELSTDEGAFERISLSGASKEEVYVLSLLVHHEDLLGEFLEAGPQDVIELMTHQGVRAMLAVVAEEAKAHPDAFVDLAARLSTRVDDPALLNVAMCLLPQAKDDSEKSRELARKVMGDYLAAIRRRIQKVQGKTLVKQLKDHPSPENLEAFQSLQRSRLGFDPAKGAT
jgi:DNA primase